ncbi:hypothetical protein GUJ93_ZPchr0010g9270 [Zizania palustris]|uniref:Transcription factor n=1 Tax=Zizania palustris TaxID=103762 RepID=A0A8J5WCK0_ZIZPA|nr:hypothetical protein GUJ93_ZPchr0010g9270 [Zizania palustris]
MDELVVSPNSSFSPPSSFFSGTGGLQVLELETCEVPEQWLLAGDHSLDWDYGAASWASLSVRAAGNPPAVMKRRGRKPGPRTDGPQLVGGVGHVEAERKRRDKLNRRFCDLRATVPTVSGMDRASLLADAAAYIVELRGRVERLEAEAGAPKAPSAAGGSLAAGGLEFDLEVRMVDRVAAALRLTSSAAATHHAPALLMSVLRSLDMEVQHACVCRVGAVTVQDAVVDVPAALQDEGRLRTALLHRLWKSGV